MRVPFVDLKAEVAAVRPELDEAMGRVLDSGWFIKGPEGEAFEAEFAARVGTRHAISVNSGSDALWLTLQALGVGPGDEVVTVAHTFVSTVDAVVRCSATPRFVDVDPETYTMDLDGLAGAVGPRTRAVLPVHLYGHPVDVEAVREAAPGVPVVEDAAQAHGASFRGRAVGALGTAACFSFYPTKNLGALGDGGAVTTDDDALARRLRMARDYGQERKNEHRFVGANSRLDELQAAALRVRLRHLDADNERRRSIARRYDAALADLPVVLPREAEGARHVHHLYVVRLPDQDRDAVQARLAEAGVQTQVHYPTPVHRQPAYGHLRAGPLPVTEEVCARILSLPLHPRMPPGHVDAVAAALRDALR